MRFDSPIRSLKIYMRMGVVTVASNVSVMTLTHLDPALIGKTMHSLAVTYPPVRGWPRLRRELDLDGAIGVDDPDEYACTTADIFLTSEGDEARLSIHEPRESSEVEQSFMDLTPMLSTTPPLRLPPDAPSGNNQLLIPPWEDPEMLGQAVLEGFRLVRPPFIDGMSSVFDIAEPRRRSSVHRAAEYGDVQGLSERRWWQPRSVDRRDASGATPLMVAAEHRQVAAIERLIELGAEVDLRDHQGRTALHYAAMGGGVDASRRLLDSGAEPAAQDEYGQTPLHIAASGGSPELLRALLDAGASVDVPDTVYLSTPLHMASRAGRTDTMETLIEGGADLDARNERGRTPLHVAASYGHVGCARALIRAGAEVDSRDCVGRTPLFGSTFFQHLDCLRLLIGEGADTGARDRDGNTPLHIAASMNRDRAARLFLRCGADVAPLNDEGLTPIDIALINVHDSLTYDLDLPRSIIFGDEHNSEVCSVLLEHGARIVPERIPVGDRHVLWPHLTPSELVDEHDDLDWASLLDGYDLTIDRASAVTALQDMGGRIVSDTSTRKTILHDAILKGMPDVFRAVLSSGASPDTAEHGPSTPLHLAAVLGKTDFAQMLLDAGAQIERPHFEPMFGIDRRFGLGRAAWGQETALDVAVANGQVEVARLLLERGAAPFTIDLEAVQRRMDAWMREQSNSHRLAPMRAPHSPLRQCPSYAKEAIVSLFEEFGLEV